MPGEKRNCGGCAACCKIPTIEEPSWKAPDGSGPMVKPPFQWCRFARPGYDGACCSIYEDRPGHCRAFRCLWLDNPITMPHWLRPDRSKVTFVPKGTDEEGRNVVEVWEMIPGALRTRKVVEWMQEAQTRNNLAFKFGNIWKTPMEAEADEYILPFGTKTSPSSSKPPSTSSSTS